MILNSTNLQTLFIAYKAAFQTGFESAVPTWDRIATEVMGSAIDFEYGWLGQFPQLRQWIGDRQVKSMAQYAYKVTNVPYESTVGVDRRMIEADQHGMYGAIFRAEGEAARLHPESLVYSLLQAGNTSLCYDGQYFFDTDHPENGTTASNWGAGASTQWYLLCTDRFLKPLIFQKRKEYSVLAMTDPESPGVFSRREFLFGVDGDCAPAYGLWQMAYASKQTLDSTNYLAARTAIQSRVSDAGRPLGYVPNLLVVPPALEKAARDLVAPVNASGATNTWAGTAQVLVSPYLS